MSDRSALLQAVAANPDDTLVRMVYADFLDETGKAEDAVRAEFIRLQCEYARLVPPRGGAQASDTPIWEVWESGMKDAFANMFADDLAAERRRSPELRRLEQIADRVKELFTAHGNGWVGGVVTQIGLPAPATVGTSFWRAVGVLTRVAKRSGWPYGWGHTSVGCGDPKGLPAGFHGLTFWCGFADELRIDPTVPAVRPVLEKWAALGPARRLVLTQTDESQGDFWPTAEHLRAARTVVLDLEFGADLFRALVVAHEAEAASLEVTIRRDMVPTLAASDLIRTVRRLHITFHTLVDFDTLAATETPALRELVLDFDHIDENVAASADSYPPYAEAMGRLAAGVMGANLHTLTVQHAAANADFTRHVSASPPWRWVTTLTLEYPLGPDAVTALAQGTGLPDVTDLTLCLNRKTMTGEPYRSPPEPDEGPPSRRSREGDRRSGGEPRPVKKVRPVPVARPVAEGGPPLVARRVGAIPPPTPTPSEIPTASPAPDPNGWDTALRWLSRWPTLSKLRRLRLTIRARRANVLDMDFFDIEGQPRFVGLPSHGLGRLAAALAAGQLERLEIAGPAVDERGRAELEKHLPGKVVYL